MPVRALHLVHSICHFKPEYSIQHWYLALHLYGFFFVFLPDGISPLLLSPSEISSVALTVLQCVVFLNLSVSINFTWVLPVGNIRQPGGKMGMFGGNVCAYVLCSFVSVSQCLHLLFLFYLSIYIIWEGIQQDDIKCISSQCIFLTACLSVYLLLRLTGYGIHHCFARSMVNPEAEETPIFQNFYTEYYTKAGVAVASCIALCPAVGLMGRRGGLLMFMIITALASLLQLGLLNCE